MNENDNFLSVSGVLKWNENMLSDSESLNIGLDSLGFVLGDADLTAQQDEARCRGD